MTDCVTTTRSADGVVTLTINRPGRLNALSWETMDVLREALEEAGRAQGTRAIVLTGEGRAFSAGADLADVGLAEDIVQSVADGMAHKLNPLCEAMLAAPVPTLAAVNGPCVGGGAGLALLADVTVAKRSAYFLIPQVDSLGIAPDLGATWALPRLIGRARSMGASLFGERISAQRAEDWGLIWRCVDDELFDDEVASLAKRLANVNPSAATATRRLVSRVDTPLREQLQLERAEQIPLLENGRFADRLGQFA